MCTTSETASVSFVKFVARGVSALHFLARGKVTKDLFKIDTKLFCHSVRHSITVHVYRVTAESWG